VGSVAAKEKRIEKKENYFCCVSTDIVNLETVSIAEPLQNRQHAQNCSEAGGIYVSK